MSLADNITDTGVKSLQTKNAILQETCDKHGEQKDELTRMVHKAIDMLCSNPEHLRVLELIEPDESLTAKQKYFKAIKTAVSNATEDHPGEPEKTAPERGGLDG